MDETIKQVMEASVGPHVSVVLPDGVLVFGTGRSRWGAAVKPASIVYYTASRPRAVYVFEEGVVHHLDVVPADVLAEGLWAVKRQTRALEKSRRELEEIRRMAAAPEATPATAPRMDIPALVSSH